MSEKTVFKLGRPIEAHGEQVTELQLREPAGQDLLDLGYPYLVTLGDGEGERIELRPKVMAKYVSRLAAIPPSAVAQISLPDLQQLQGVVMGFFGGSE